MKTIIEITNLSKKYPLIHDKAPYRTFREAIMNRIRHPFTKTKTHETFWALKDINLTINRGEIIGIIGKNGAGKSTLLKILSRITKPSEGKIKLYGRVSSLLEVGTGFHPELTGRENIFLNGVILGMTRKEVAKKFNEIVTFAGVEQFLDTPVKHYSSGMYVRLAFAIAAHLEPDILIIDEVLAVGDIEFQKKCLGKMEEVSKEEGRTVIFVSHNMSAIKRLCNKCILINEGKMINYGNTDDIVNQYLNKKTDSLAVHNFQHNNNKEACIYKISILNSENKSCNNIPVDKSFSIEIEYKINKEIDNSVICLFISSADNDLLLLASDGDLDGKLKKYKVGIYKTIIHIPAFLFNVGKYIFNIAIEKPYIEYIDIKENIEFEVIDTKDNPKSKILSGKNLGKMAQILNFNSIKI